MSLDIKEVIRVARAQFKELLPELSIEATDIRLEEIEREGDNWALTFSVPNPKVGVGIGEVREAYSALLGARVAKVVVVDGSKGQFLALRERAA